MNEYKFIHEVSRQEFRNCQKQENKTHVEFIRKEDFIIEVSVIEEMSLIVSKALAVSDNSVAKRNYSWWYRISF